MSFIGKIFKVVSVFKSTKWAFPSHKTDKYLSFKASIVIWEKKSFDFPLISFKIFPFSSVVKNISTFVPKDATK